jgi:hypothetical protein
MCKLCNLLIIQSVKTEMQILVTVYIQKMHTYHSVCLTHSLSLTNTDTHTHIYIHVSIHQCTYSILRGQFVHFNELITL